ncbi:MAG: hypothetical protein GOU98_02190 [Candidatus Altiarchaeota archaeon]|nr:hypothetical protein [Candidatus Altiarchaeota archaeon]
MFYGKFTEWYSKNYRALMIIPLIVFIIATFAFYYTYKTTGSVFELDIDLSGGTVFTVYTNLIQSGTKEYFTDLELSFREIRSYDGGDLIAVAIEGGPQFTQSEILSEIELKFPDLEYDVKSVGPSMGKSFMRGSIIAVGLGFLAMGIILALIFRHPIVAFTVILSGFLNVFETAAFMTFFGVKLAPHTIGALLMLMGWSVDSEVLFDTKILRGGSGDPKKRALLAMKTAMTMSAAIFASLSALYLVSTSTLIKDIALVMMLGAFFDIINTWFQSLSMVLWYAETKS